MAGKLTERQRRFVAAFLGEAQGNATRAALMAGATRAGACTRGYRWLRKAQVQRAIMERVERREAKTEMSNEELDAILIGIASKDSSDEHNRIAAVKELNKCRGRHSMTHLLKGEVTVSQSITNARHVPADQRA